MIQLFGIIGSFLLIFSCIPQLYTTYSKKTVEGLSLWMLVTLDIGCLSMLIYVLNEAIKLPIILNYCFNILITSVNIWLYFKYRNGYGK